MNTIRLCATIGIVGMLAACAQQEEPSRVAPEPVYDKVGGGSCDGDWIYVRGTAQRADRCVPPDECEPQYDSAGNVIECLPPRPRTPGGGSDGGGGGRPSSTTPGAGSATRG